MCKARRITVEQLAGQLVRGGLNKKQAVAAVKNWKKGFFRPLPRKEDISRLAAAISVDVNDIVQWCSSYRYAPMSPQKAKLVAQLIVGRDTQQALDILKFTSKRAATMMEKVLKTAIADADEQQADVDSLYVSRARVDDAGVRLGTKRWFPKDRGRAHPIRKKACHIHITVSQV